MIKDREEPQYEKLEALALTKVSIDSECYADNRPHNLSMTCKASASLEDNVIPTKCESALNLSKKSSSSMWKEKLLVNDIISSSSSSVMFSLACDMDSSMKYEKGDIHIRRLTAASTGFTTKPYQCDIYNIPMRALWNTYHPNTLDTFSSPRSICSYQDIPPSSSPGSKICSEPEDLSVRSETPSPQSSDSSVYSQSKVAKLKVTKNNKSFKSENCKKMYSTSIGLSKQHSCQERKQHACSDCGKLYTSKDLKNHIGTHTLPCKCPICGKAFSRPWLVQCHIRTHTGEKPFQCPDCPRAFAGLSNLRAHQQTHVDVKKYVCKVCNKTFSRKSLLNTHANSNCTIAIM